MKERLTITAKIWGLKLRNLVAWGGQVAGFAVILFGAFMMFHPLLAGLGIPINTLPVDAMVQFYERLGLHWIALMVIGAISVWLSTRT